VCVRVSFSVLSALFFVAAAVVIIAVFGLSPKTPSSPRLFFLDSIVLVRSGLLHTELPSCSHPFSFFPPSLLHLHSQKSVVAAAGRCRSSFVTTRATSTQIPLLVSPPTLGPPLSALLYFPLHCCSFLLLFCLQPRPLLRLFIGVFSFFFWPFSLFL
jgi:hypothetical protein